MSEKLSAEQVATVIYARQLLKQKGLPADADVKAICQHAGISRKTGYQWAGKLAGSSQDQAEPLRREHEQLKAEHEALKKRFDDVRFENEGRKLAWEIHGIDKLLAEKKTTMDRVKKKKP